MDQDRIMRKADRRLWELVLVALEKTWDMLLDHSTPPGVRAKLISMVLKYGLESPENAPETRIRPKTPDDA